MSATTAIRYHPPLPTYSTLLRKSWKSISRPSFPFSKSHLCGEFVAPRPVWRHGFVPAPITMAGSVSASSFRNSDGDRRFETLEQESLISGSSGFRPDFAAAAGSLESTLNNLSKWLVAALFASVILSRHDAESLWAAMGSILNSGLSTVLKQILNQERPVTALRSDPGMPSSHAQAIFFSVVFIVISVVQWLGTNGLTITLSGLTLALGSYLSWLRVSQKLHTISQVAVGAVVGSLFSILWFWFWDAFVHEAFISSLYVQIVIITGAVSFCLAFLVYVIRFWVMDAK